MCSDIVCFHQWWWLVGLLFLNVLGLIIVDRYKQTSLDVVLNLCLEFGCYIRLAWYTDESWIMRAPTLFRAYCSSHICFLKFAKVFSSEVFTFHFFNESTNARVRLKMRYAIYTSCLLILLLVVMVHRSWNSVIFVKILSTSRCGPCTYYLSVSSISTNSSSVILSYVSCRKVKISEIDSLIISVSTLRRYKITQSRSTKMGCQDLFKSCIISALNRSYMLDKWIGDKSIVTIYKKNTI